MKFGVISYEKKILKLDGKDAQNIGDWLQMFAMEYLFCEWGITDLIHISRNDATNYDGEYCVLPINGFFTCNDAPHISTKTFPLSRKIIPVFWSFHFHDRYIPSKMKEQLMMYAPIGCRDEETMLNLRRNGISAFVTGCVSALLPMRSESVAEKADKIIFVDVPDGLEGYVPEEYKNEIEYFENVYPIMRTHGETIMTDVESRNSLDFARARYEYYCNNAKLIVTSRLHVAAPAMAMGIPCILVAENIDNRYSWIDKFLPLYTSNSFSEIDWNPQPVRYEEQKKIIKDALKKRLFQMYDRYEDLAEISDFFENRTKVEYNAVYRKALRCFDSLPTNTKYAIWGTVTNKSNQLKHCIDELYPQWQFEGIFDKVAKGNFEGHEILSSDEVTENGDVVYFVMSKAIHSEAKRKLSTGRYVLVDVEKDEFDNNFLNN